MKMIRGWFCLVFVIVVLLGMPVPTVATELTGETVREVLSQVVDPVIAASVWQQVMAGKISDLEDLNATTEPDRERILLIGHPYGAVAGEAGLAVRSLTLPVGGELRDDGIRLEIGVRPARIAFSPDGGNALVLGERGTLVSLRVDSVREITIVDRVQLPVPGSHDIVFQPGTRRAWIVIGGVDESTGIFTVELAEDGKITVLDSPYSVRQASALALLPGTGQRAVLVGGQVSYDPVDPRDLRILDWKHGQWAEVAALDIFQDQIDTLGIAVSADGRTVLVPNGAVYSSEGGQCLVLGVEGDRLVERQRLTDLPDLRAARFAPDGRTALLSQFEPGRVVVLDCDGGQAKITARLRVPLAAEMAMVERGPDGGRVVIPSVDPADGPQLVVLKVAAPGQVEETQRLRLGPGYINIPGTIGIAP